MKHVCSVIAVAAMLSPTVIPSVYPPPTDPLALFRWKLVLIVISIIGVIGFVIQIFFQHREEKRKELESRADHDKLIARLEAMQEQQEKSDLHFQELAAVILPKSTPTTTDDKLLESVEPIPPEFLNKLFVAEVDIRDRIRSLARDLFTFLKEQGPGPMGAFDNTKESLHKYVTRIWEPLRLWIAAVHNGYNAKFREQLESLMRELAEKGITNTGIGASEIDPPNGQSDGGIRAIAEKLYILAAKMDISEAEK